MKSTAPPRSRRVLGLVFLTVFLDLVGFSVLFPLFPDLLRWYLEREGSASALGRLVAWLSGLLGERSDGAFAVAALFGGVLGTLYSALQFFFAPLWGSLSDRYGRRPLLLFTLAGTAVAHLLWMFAGSFLLLVVSRALGGIMAGNISTASAAVADVSSGRERSGGMAIVGMAVGLGFVLGPALGAIAYHSLDAEALFPAGAPLGWNPFSIAATLAFALAVVNFLWAFARFPETLRDRTGAEGRARERLSSALSPWRSIRRVATPDVVRANAAYFATQTAFAAMEFTLVFLAAERFGFAPRDNAWMFVFVGLVIALVQGGFVRRRAAAIGEKKLAVLGIATLVPGFALVGISGGVATLYVGLFLLAAGSALVVPTLSALVSLYTPSDRQGTVLGAFRATGAASRAVGPVLGGLLYFGLGSRAPYLIGALFLLLPWYLASRLPQPDTRPEG
jgi:MFS family permease